MYSDFVFLDRFLFELLCKNTHTDTQTHTDSNEYPIVAFSKNATIMTKGGPTYYVRNGVNLGSLLKYYRHFKNRQNAKILSSLQKLLNIIFRY